MDEWDETINTPEELEEANKRFMEKVRKLREDEPKQPIFHLPRFFYIID
jgi:hypothetical protein